MLTTYFYNNKQYYLQIDRNSLAIRMVPLRDSTDKYRVTIIRKVTGEKFGDALDAIPSGYQKCYVNASTTIAFTDEGVTRAEREVSYDVKVLGGVLEFEDTQANKLLDALEVNNNSN